MHFSTLCGLDDKERENALQACLKKIDEWEGMPDDIKARLDALRGRV